MPDIRVNRGPRAIVRDGISDAFWRIYWWGFWSTELAAAVLVSAVAAVLSAVHSDLQYVAGAVLIVFARKLATKRIYQPVKPDKPEETSRPTREMLARYGDKRAAQLDVNIAP